MRRWLRFARSECALIAELNQISFLRKEQSSLCSFFFYRVKTKKKILAAESAEDSRRTRRKTLQPADAATDVNFHAGNGSGLCDRWPPLRLLSEMRLPRGIDSRLCGR